MLALEWMAITGEGVSLVVVAIGSHEFCQDVARRKMGARVSEARIVKYDAEIVSANPLFRPTAPNGFISIAEPGCPTGRHTGRKQETTMDTIIVSRQSAPPGGWTVEDCRAALDRAIQWEEQEKAVSSRLMEEDRDRVVAQERATVARETWDANRHPNDRR